MTVPFAPLLVSAGLGLAKDAIGTVAKALDPKAAQEAKARKTATEFETMFLEQTLDRMFSSVGEEGPLGNNGVGGDVYRSMLVKEYAGTIVKSGGIGLGDQIFREIMRLQEG
jgi:Rod binding domain-containing protein